MTTPRKNPVEWLVFAAGLGLIVGLVSYLGYAAATSSNEPPRLVVELGAIDDVENGYRVELRVANHGATTAAGVTVEVLDTRLGATARAEVTLAFVPHGSSRRAWVVLKERPDRTKLHARVLGYEEP